MLIEAPASRHTASCMVISEIRTNSGSTNVISSEVMLQSVALLSLIITRYVPGSSPSIFLSVVNQKGLPSHVPSFSCCQVYFHEPEPPLTLACSFPFTAPLQLISVGAIATCKAARWNTLNITSLASLQVSA